MGCPFGGSLISFRDSVFSSTRLNGRLGAICPLCKRRCCHSGPGQRVAGLCPSVAKDYFQSGMSRVAQNGGYGGKMLAGYSGCAKSESTGIDTRRRRAPDQESLKEILEALESL